MLCTQCSKPVRPVVAVDIDGTLGNYHEHFETFAQRWLGVHDEAWVVDLGYDGSQPYRDWFTMKYGVDVTTFRAIKLAYRQGGMKRTMPVYAHAQGTVVALRQRAEVWLTTTRPHDRYDRIDPDTVEWLRRHRIPFDALLFDEDKIGELYRNVDAQRVVAVLDDEVAHLERVPTGTPILLRSQYNEQAEWDNGEASSLPSAWHMINQLLQEWEEEHERA
jgi:hypothetical protein